METVTINKQARLSQHFTLGELCKTSFRGSVHMSSEKRNVLYAVLAF